MKRITVVASLCVVALLVSRHALAQTLRLEVNSTSMETWISNVSAATIQMDAYQISSSAGILDIVNWQSIDESAASAPGAVATILGSGALGFIDPGGSNPFFMMEVNPSSFGTWNPSTRWSIGFPFGTSLSALASTLPANPVFEYTFPSGGVIGGPIVIIPEPATAVLMTVAFIAVVSGRERKCWSQKVGGDPQCFTPRPFHRP